MSARESNKIICLQTRHRWSFQWMRRDREILFLESDLCFRSGRGTTIRSFPRKRGPGETNSEDFNRWIPAYAGMNGLYGMALRVFPTKRARVNMRWKTRHIRPCAWRARRPLRPPSGPHGLDRLWFPSRNRCLRSSPAISRTGEDPARTGKTRSRNPAENAKHRRAHRGSRGRQGRLESCACRFPKFLSAITRAQPKRAHLSQC